MPLVQLDHANYALPVDAGKHKYLSSSLYRSFNFITFVSKIKPYNNKLIFGIQD